MERNDSGDRYVDAHLPRELHDRVERLFREYRGYDSTSLQESLSVICDLAERQLDSDGASPTNDTESVGTHSEVDSGEAGATSVQHEGTDAGIPANADEPLRAAIDEVFPTDWAQSAEAADRLPMVVTHYLNASGSTRVERENTAFSAVAARHGTTAEELRTQLVDEIYGADALPGELASEFFSEALGKVEGRLERVDSDALSTGEVVDAEAAADDRQQFSGAVFDVEETPTETALDLGAGSTDLPEELADEMASDGGAVQSVDERVDNLFTGPNGLMEIGLESLVDGAATECELCGETHSVIDLETTTEASDDRRVNLVCPDCAPQ